ncbi:hypothetical protein Cme02nite_72910 [Catellatospora methionotrophica]|uniref:Uncharacterized protein n=1 Tax=Catellatospora methionotrophica TaxID=121620 RepID=A0A8J3LHD3_9ACTN|nr:hypothetical protein [Catellatospora methionotrophica]GIG18959.1 hypothetical protein Cme02nite_72910 [Catellatospora methionotrophica]
MDGGRIIDTSQQTGPVGLDRFRLTVAAVVLAAAGGAGAVMAVPGRGLAPGYTGTLYTAHHQVLVALLALCGVLLIAMRRPALTGAVAVAGAITAAQLCATGVWAFRHWRPMIGMNGIPEANLNEVRPLAQALAIVSALAVLACLALAHRSGVRQPGPAGRPRLRLLIGAALAVAVLPVLGIVETDFLIRKIATQILLYSLPWGLAVAACVRLHRPAALAAALAVGLSALARTAHAMATTGRYGGLSFALPEIAAFAAVTALAVGVAVLTVRGTPAASAAALPGSLPGRAFTIDLDASTEASPQTDR